MKKSKKQLLRSGIAGLLIASMAVGGGTLAYLTDSETTDNTFTVGKDWDISSVEAKRFSCMFEDCPSHPTFTKRAGTWDSNGTFTPTT